MDQIEAELVAMELAAKQTPKEFYGQGQQAQAARRRVIEEHAIRLERLAQRARSLVVS